MAYVNATAFPMSNQVGLGVINANEVPGLPEFNPGVDWPTFIKAVREAFRAYATRNTGGSISPQEWNQVMEAAQNWANGQVYAAHNSGADVYYRAVQEPHTHWMIPPTNQNPVIRQYASEPRPSDGVSWITGREIIAAWEAGTPITSPMLGEGEVEWAALLANRSAEEAAAAEAAAREAHDAAVAAATAKTDAPVPEATPSGVTQAVYIQEGEEGEEPVVVDILDDPEAWDKIKELQSADLAVMHTIDDLALPENQEELDDQDGEEAPTSTSSPSPSRAGFSMGKEGLIIGGFLLLPFLFSDENKGGPRRW